jgi:hypothetical protein
MLTAVKRHDEGQIYTQVTPRPNRKILLYNQAKEKCFFPLVRDREVGIGTKFQEVVIESVKMCGS